MFPPPAVLFALELRRNDFPDDVFEEELGILVDGGVMFDIEILVELLVQRIPDRYEFHGGGIDASVFPGFVI